MKKNYLTLFFLCFSSIVISQDIELYQQFNGQYDYTAIGATLNSCENNICGICEIEDSATANLTMQASQTVVAAYLYWAGSGSGDFEVELNNQPISAERSFSRFLSFNSGEFEFFSAFADITTIIQNTGNANYTVSEIDLQNAIDEAYKKNSKSGIEEELGDILFTAANLCRLNKIDPEIALNQSSDKFLERAKIFLAIKTNYLNDEDAWEEAKLTLKKRRK